MPAPQLHNDWTVEMVHALPDDGNRYEVIDGELFVTPSPAPVHQEAVAVLFILMREYAESVGLWLAFAPAAVYLSPRREVQPDLLALPRVNGRRPERFEDVRVLTLVVEVLSPSTMRADRYVKRGLYRSLPVPEYWIIDTANRIVERWRPEDEEPEILDATLIWQPVPGREALGIDLVRYFRAVHDESSQ